MSDRITREVLTIILARIEEGAVLEIPVSHRETISGILDKEYARPVRLIDKGNGTFLMRRALLGVPARGKSK